RLQRRDHAVRVVRLAAGAGGEVEGAATTHTTADPGLDHDPGADRIGDGGSLHGHPSHDLVPGHERVGHVAGLALPDLNVGPRNTCRFDGEPSALFGRPHL